MSRGAITMMVLLMVAFAAVAVAAETARPRETNPGRPTDKGPDGGTDSGNSSANEGQSRRQAGRLTVGDEGATGRYVNFTMDLASCRVTDYQVYGMVVFSQILLPGADCRLVGGAPGRVEMRSQDGSLRIHDSPNALLQFQGEEPVELFVGSLVDATLEEGGVSFTFGNLTGRAFGRNDTALAFEGGVMSGLEGTVMVRPASGTSPERREIFEAIQKGRVGAETALLSENGSLVSEVLTFDDVRVSVGRPEPQRFDFTVDGNLTEGRVFITHIDPAVWDPERLRIDYSDVDEGGERHGVLIRQADTLEDVLDFDPGKGPVYFVFQDEEGWHAAVAVPKFSVHVFQVVGLPLQVVPLLLYGIVIGGLFLAAGGVGIFLERRARTQ